eukprot:6224819-Ditylum_brightwellii.AAC.1
MPISSRAHGNMTLKTTTKAGLATEAGKVQQCKTPNSGNKVLEKITKEAEEQQSPNQAAGFSLRRKINAIVDAQLSQYNKNNDKEKEKSKNAEANPMEGETTTAEKLIEIHANPTQ